MTVDAESSRLTASEHATLSAALDALLPSSGSFPAPSSTDMIDDFILKNMPAPGTPPEYPGLDLDDLREILEFLDGEPRIVEALKRLEAERLEQFAALWAMAVFGYYSRAGVVAAIQYDNACAYHGAPLPLGYAHVISPWDVDDPRQMPVEPPGRYIATDDVRRVDLDQLEASSR